MSSHATGPTPERLALAKRVAAMRRRGMVYREIQAALGISYTYAQELANDPEGTQVRARKDRYRGVCISCGAHTSGSNGVRNAPRRCAACGRVAAGATRRGTGKNVTDALALFSTPEDVLTFSAIGRALGISHGHTSMLLLGRPYGLLASGFVERIGRGQYRRIVW